MPQSSLMGWLTKPAPKSATVVERQDEAQKLPTPPATSSDDETGADALKTKVETRMPVGTQSLPPNVEFRECRQEDIKSLKRLNSLLLPIPYGDAFYREIREDEVISNITVMALWRDDSSSNDRGEGTLVGAIRCKLLASLPRATLSTRRKGGPMLYLSTLVLLSPYRGHGIAAKMLDIMIRRAVNDYGIASVGAHVWEANVEGLAWYRKRGFYEVAREGGYYPRLNPQGAVVMMKDIGVMDLLPN